MVEHVTRSDRIALVVDDDVFVLSAMAELLSEEGYDVHTSSNGFSALRQAAEFWRTHAQICRTLRNARMVRDGPILCPAANVHGTKC